jgi:hypothetical protein
MFFAVDDVELQLLSGGVDPTIEIDGFAAIWQRSVVERGYRSADCARVMRCCKNSRPKRGRSKHSRRRLAKYKPRSIRFGLSLEGNCGVKRSGVRRESTTISAGVTGSQTAHGDDKWSKSLWASPPERQTNETSAWEEKEPLSGKQRNRRLRRFIDL